MHQRFLLVSLIQILMVSISLAQPSGAHFKQIKNAFLTPGSKVVLVAAHRGAHLEHPENSMPAFRKAIELGIDIIELDTRCTKDGVIVLMHDRTVNRTTNGSGAVDSLTFSEIRKLRLKHNGKLTNEQVPTLEEALLLAKGKILIDLDIKTADCIQGLMTMIEKTKSEDNAFFFVANGAYAKFVKDKNPAFKTLVRTHSPSQVDSVFTLVKTEAVHIDPSHYTIDVVKKIRENGGRVWINALGTVDTKAASGNLSAFDEVLDKGANIIQTDQPALLMKYLKSKGLYHQEGEKLAGF